MKTSASKAISILSEIKLDSHSSHSGSNQPSNIPTSPTEEHLLATWLPAVTPDCDWVYPGRVGVGLYKYY